jgi:hypothetical protein
MEEEGHKWWEDEDGLCGPLSTEERDEIAEEDAERVDAELAALGYLVEERALHQEDEVWRMRRRLAHLGYGVGVRKTDTPGEADRRQARIARESSNELPCGCGYGYTCHVHRRASAETPAIFSQEGAASPAVGGALQDRQSHLPFHFGADETPACAFSSSSTGPFTMGSPPPMSPSSPPPSPRRRAPVRDGSRSTLGVLRSEPSVRLMAVQVPAVLSGDRDITERSSFRCRTGGSSWPGFRRAWSRAHSSG